MEGTRNRVEWTDGSAGIPGQYHEFRFHPFEPVKREMQETSRNLAANVTLVAEENCRDAAYLTDSESYLPVYRSRVPETWYVAQCNM